MWNKKSRFVWLSVNPAHLADVRTLQGRPPLPHIADLCTCGWLECSEPFVYFLSLSINSKFYQWSSCVMSFNIGQGKSLSCVLRPHKSWVDSLVVKGFFPFCPSCPPSPPTSPQKINWSGSLGRTQMFFVAHSLYNNSNPEASDVCCLACVDVWLSTRSFIFPRLITWY